MLVYCQFVVSFSFNSHIGTCVETLCDYMSDI